MRISKFYELLDPEELFPVRRRFHNSETINFFCRDSRLLPNVHLDIVYHIWLGSAKPGVIFHLKPGTRNHQENTVYEIIFQLAIELAHLYERGEHSIRSKPSVQRFLLKVIITPRPLPHFPSATKNTLVKKKKISEFANIRNK